MYDPKSLDELFASLEQKLNEASRAEKFLDVVKYATALERLKAWIAQGQPGELPREVTEIPGLAWQEIVRPLSAASSAAPRPAAADAPVAPLPTAPASLAPAASGPGDVTFAAALQAARADIARSAFAEAQSRLSVLRGQAASPAEQSQIEEAERELRARQRAALDSAVEAARNATRTQSDPAQQRRLWEQVARVDPAHLEATAELKRLDELALAQGAFAKLDAIRSQIFQIRKNVTRLEEERRTVESLLYDPNVRTSSRRAEVEELLKQLNDYRAEIQRASEGGTSSERSSDYEKALDVYRKAIMAGYEMIVDDTSGLPVNPAEALARTQTAFFKDQVRRSEARYNDAAQVLTAGAPEVAVQRLREAQELLAEVADSSGDEWRGRVEKLLDEATQQAQAKQEAEKLVIQAEETPDPQQARLFLLRAQQGYRGYPQIQERIRAKEQQVLRSVLNDLRSSLARADALLDQRKFDEARTVGESALRSGQNLDFATNDKEYQEYHSRAATLLERIGAAQSRWQKLQERLTAIQAALKAHDLRLARRLLDAIGDGDATDPAVTELRTTLSLAGDDDQQWQDAQRAFGAQGYEQVITLCEKLQESASIRERARELGQRAQARLWNQRATAASNLDQAEAFFHKLVGLRGLLPAEDRSFVDDAETALKQLRAERSRGQQLQQRLADIHELRVLGKWHEWYQKLLALEQEAPDWFKAEIVNERSGGLEEWRIDAFDQAERLLLDNPPDWRKAFDLVHPLYRTGAVADDDARYRTIARHYHHSEATRWEASSDPRDLEKAVEHRRNAFNLAEPPALAEKQALTHAIRQRALRQAQFAATNPGPHEAVAVLQKQLTTHEFELKEDADLRSHLIRYALLAGNFEVAQREAQVLQYLPGLAEAARSWQQLVSALQTFHQDGALSSREQGVRSLAQLRSTSIDHALLTTTLSEFAASLADGLHATLPAQVRTLTNDDILQRVRVYDLILQLRPDDQRARAGVSQLADRLQQISQQLADRARRLLGNQPANTHEEVRQLEALDGEFRALLQAFVLLNQMTTPVAQQLAQQQERTQRRSQQLHDLHRQLDEVQAQYHRTLSETWLIAPVETALQAALQTARQAGAGPQLAVWEERVSQLGTALDRLKASLGEIERAWVSDQFREVVTGCDRFSEELQRSRLALAANDLALPGSHLVLYDAQRQRRLTTLDEIRTVAALKEQNLATWRRWVQLFQTLQAEVREVGAAAEKELTAPLPCLTKGRQHLALLSQHYQTFCQHLAELPPAPLGNEAIRYARQMSEANLLTEVERQLQLTQERSTKVEARRTEVEAPLQRLRTFWKGNPNLQLEGNKRNFRAMVNAVRQIDACHPDLEPMIERFQRITHETV